VELTKAERMVIERCRRNLRWNRRAVWAMGLSAVFQASMLVWLCAMAWSEFQAVRQAWPQLIFFLARMQFAIGVSFLILVNCLYFLPILLFAFTHSLGALFYIPQRERWERLTLKLYDAIDRQTTDARSGAIS
jgi:hypothetical protein